MAKIGLFYSSTSKTEAAETIQKAFSNENVIALHKIVNVTDSNFANYDRIINAYPTWKLGGL